MLKKVPIMTVSATAKSLLLETARARSGKVLFYTLLGFDSLQFSVDCPTDKIIPRHYATINCFYKIENTHSSSNIKVQTVWCRNLLLDCSCGLQQSTSMLFMQLQGFVAQLFSCYCYYVLQEVE